MRIMLLLCGVVVVGIVWWFLDDGWRSNISPKVLLITKDTPDDQVQSVLLSHTPLGSTAMEVLTFIVDELGSAESTDANHSYVTAFNETRKAKADILQTYFEGDDSRMIRVELATYRERIFMASVNAKWFFDDLGRVTEIFVYRRMLGP